ncbi:FAD dependent oxidoreductase [Pedobacter steynii]|uniref:FAD dependent oxidoreductase n=1 Tax=Pedobacter steynii TaxID=430522 RepID=A0A1G9NJL4_9SPHI|nr:FAD-dependent oxidoreductase [Pedobacter steynii]NQX39292.1 FAD-dependent oxidoreductase [Pedobacter steynii]SDL86165.1 FAD dependent oxidoreductase [Pedobacter steynii]
MIREESQKKRTVKSESAGYDLVVVGGGLSGVCCAITAARKGLKVVLVQDRPVLGGNSSSEVRLWILGATSHMGNNNRWAREGGVVDEILLENMQRNPEGNPVIFDTVLLDKIYQEPNIKLLLNTAVYDLEKSDADEISSVKCFCSQNSTEYILTANLFCDASGDGILGFLAGAAFRMGAENKDEFGEKFAPDQEYGELLGHSIYFYSKDTGKPVKYIAPSFALADITKIPRFKSFNAKEFGCKLWWLEYGGRMDTVHESENIKQELWKVVYGVWNYIKNSGEFPEAETMTLEWVGSIPGKRESRRFEGDYMLNQQDIVSQHLHEDAIGYGGWSIDLHPADGVFSNKPGCNQWHSKGIYQIPYRCLYSRNIKNLFLTGRIISASHVAFASSRVMATGAYLGQAVGMAAFIAKKNKLQPKALNEKGIMKSLQLELMKSGQHIPGMILTDAEDLVQSANITASTEMQLDEIPFDFMKHLDISAGQMIPLQAGKIPSFTFSLESSEETTLQVELRISGKSGNFSPDELLEIQQIPVNKGPQVLITGFGAKLNENAYVYLCFRKNPAVKLGFSNTRITGVLSVFNSVNKAVSNFGSQKPTEDIGVDEFEFWCPQRRPEGHNIALKIDPPLNPFLAEQIKNGIGRPVSEPNAWVSSISDQNPKIYLKWADQTSISRIELCFDTDYDHPMESVLMTHPERTMPFCIRNYTITDGNGNLLFVKKDNYQSLNIIELKETVLTDELTLQFEHPSAEIPAALFAIRCYS